MLFVSITEGVLKNFSVDKKGSYHIYRNHEVVDSIKATHTGIYTSLNEIQVSKYDIFEIEGKADFETENIKGRVMGLTVKAESKGTASMGSMNLKFERSGIYCALTGWANEDDEFKTDAVISHVSTVPYYRDELIMLADAAFAAVVAQIEIHRGMKDFVTVVAQTLRQSVTRMLQDCGNSANTIFQSTQRNLVSFVNNQSDLLVIFRPYIIKLTEKAVSGFGQKVRVTRTLYDKIVCADNFYPSRQTVHSFTANIPAHERLMVMTTKTIQEISSPPLEKYKREVERKLVTKVPLSQKLNIKTTRRLNAFTKINTPHISMRKESLKVGIWT